MREEIKPEGRSVRDQYSVAEQPKVQKEQK